MFTIRLAKYSASCSAEVANSWICVCRLVEALQGRAVPWVKLGYTLVPSAISSFLNFKVSSL